MNYFIGVDLGTSAVKTLLLDGQGQTVLTKSYAYPMYQPQNGWAEQNPKDWAEAALITIRDVVKDAGVPREAVKGIGLSGQMHGLVMLDEEDQPVGNSIIWCDQRAGKQEQEMREKLPVKTWMDITGNPPLAGWTAAKILWIRENRPQEYARCRHILLPKDYVRFILTGKYATDVSDASGMQLLDSKNRRWSEEILQALDIPEQLLGRVYESQEVTGTLLPDIAQACGLTEDTAVVAGGSDNACAAVGTGIVKEGQAFTSIGTSAIVYTHLDTFRQIPDGGLHLCCCAVPGCWHTMGGPQSAGLSIEWFKEKFCQNLIQQAKQEGISFYELLTQITSSIAPGSDRLLYLPFLMGERTPHMHSWYRGGFIGLNVVHTQAHMLRAIMEGVAYCLADCNDILKNLGVEVVSMRACGGGSKSPVWREIMAALFQCDIHTLKQEEGPALGAAILAGVGTGVFPSVQEACSRFIREDEMTACDPGKAETYAFYHRIYIKIYESLLDGFRLLYENSGES
nr:xylulokinase [uncultured Eisenbergiella sp.]